MQAPISDKAVRVYGRRTRPRHCGLVRSSSSRRIACRGWDGTARRVRNCRHVPFRMIEHDMKRNAPRQEHRIRFGHRVALPTVASSPELSPAVSRSAAADFSEADCYLPIPCQLGRQLKRRSTQPKEIACLHNSSLPGGSPSSLHVMCPSTPSSGSRREHCAARTIERELSPNLQRLAGRLMPRARRRQRYRNDNGTQRRRHAFGSHQG